MKPDDQHPGDPAYRAYLRDFQTRVVGSAANDEPVWEIDPLVAFFKSRYAPKISAQVPLIIASETTLGLLPDVPTLDLFEAQLMKGSSEQVPADLIKDFCEKNRRSREIWPDLSANFPLHLFTKSERETIFTKGPDHNWQQFYKKYAGNLGIFEVSRVGFNRNRTIALFYLGWSGGPLAGDGRLYVMRKTKAGWTVLPVSIGPAWVS